MWGCGDVAAFVLFHDFHIFSCFSTSRGFNFIVAASLTTWGREGGAIRTDFSENMDLLICHCCTLQLIRRQPVFCSGKSRPVWVPQLHVSNSRDLVLLLGTTWHKTGTWRKAFTFTKEITGQGSIFMHFQYLSGCGFQISVDRTLDISRVNQERHKWQRIDTYALSHRGLLWKSHSAIISCPFSISRYLRCDLQNPRGLVCVDSLAGSKHPTEMARQVSPLSFDAFMAS